MAYPWNDPGRLSFQPAWDNVRHKNDGGRVRKAAMTHLIYEIVEHDGGWAYRVKGVYSEAFPARALAHEAAARAAAEQRAPGENAVIQFETSTGEWVTQDALGNDRPEAEVKD
jgi:hypothetical protein